MPSFSYTALTHPDEIRILTLLGEPRDERLQASMRTIRIPPSQTLTETPNVQELHVIKAVWNWQFIPVTNTIQTTTITNGYTGKQLGCLRRISAYEISFFARKPELG